MLRKPGFRPWYPDGFVYCPTCKKPLRHNENYAIDADPAPLPEFAPQPPAAPASFTETPAPRVEFAPQPPMAPSASTETNSIESIAFCSQCGKAFREGDKFCSGCGSKRA
ncbi:MAG: hypothetical protein IJA26_00270 [Clostridia bacterium]|nr:hypothetical protein [Clostridia bacterium]